MAWVGLRLEVPSVPHANNVPLVDCSQLFSGLVERDHGLRSSGCRNCRIIM